MLSPPVGPSYQTDHSIECSCFVNPAPPEPVTYQWVVPHLAGHFQRSGQNISYIPYTYRDLRFLWFYCEVFSDATLVAEGKRLIEVHGK